MKNEIIFRKAGLQDIPHLVQLRVDFLTDYWGEQREESVSRLKDSLQAYFEREIVSGNYIAFIAFEGEWPVSMGAMVISYRPGSFRVPEAKCAYIMNMFTYKPYRRKGLAGEILELLTTEGKAMGVTIFDLHATKEGEPLYKHHGFEWHKEPSYRKIIL